MSDDVRRSLTYWGSWPTSVTYFGPWPGTTTDRSVVLRICATTRRPEGDTQ